jgi:hypothetical protein
MPLIESFSRPGDLALDTFCGFQHDVVAAVTSSASSWTRPITHVAQIPHTEHKSVGADPSSFEAFRQNLSLQKQRHQRRHEREKQEDDRPAPSFRASERF